MESKKLEETPKMPIQLFNKREREFASERNGGWTSGRKKRKSEDERKNSQKHYWIDFSHFTLSATLHFPNLNKIRIKKSIPIRLPNHHHFLLLTMAVVALCSSCCSYFSTNSNRSKSSWNYM